MKKRCMEKKEEKNLLNWLLPIQYQAQKFAKELLNLLRWSRIHDPTLNVLTT